MVRSLSGLTILCNLKEEIPKKEANGRCSIESTHWTRNVEDSILGTQALCAILLANEEIKLSR